MAIHSSFATDEPGSAEEYLSQAYLDVGLSLPDERGGFRLGVDRLDLGSFQLDTLAFGARASICFEPDQKSFISTVARGSLRIVEEGIDETLAAGDVGMVGLPGSESRVEIEDLHESLVTLSARSLRLAADLDPDGDAAPTFTSVRPVSAEHGRAWRRTTEFIAATLRTEAAVAEAPLVVGGTERLLAALALSTFPNTAVAPPARRDALDARLPATLRRAIAFVESNADRDIGIGEIAAAARVSRRAVQLAFRRHLETTPTGYLRRVRLDRAHRELRAAVPGDGLTVTEVAYRWGFCSPSRFAERYRAAFGATPSETLRR